MGLRYQYLNFIEKGMILCVDPYKPRMVELGNQKIRQNAKLVVLYRALDIPPPKTGKAFYSSRGFDHVSIDINKKDGALPFDLSKPFTKEMLETLGKFDVLTNSGTSEHVLDQYECFSNCHTITKENGIMVHIVPRTGSWLKHGDFYYDFDFFVELAEANDYGVVMGEILNKEMKTELIAICLQKREDNPFMEASDFNDKLVPLISDS